MHPQPNIHVLPLRLLIMLSISICMMPALNAQKHLSVIVRDAHTGGPVPAASVMFMNTTTGAVSDSSGTVRWSGRSWPSDTLIISSVGFHAARYYMDPSMNTIEIIADLSYMDLNPVLISRRNRNDRSLSFWKKIVASKSQNDLSSLNNLSCVQYSKTRIDLRNVRLDRINIFNPLWLFKKDIYRVREQLYVTVDSSEGHGYLPVFFTEQFSTLYVRSKPFRLFEKMHVVNDHGISNRSFKQLLEQVSAKIDVYNDKIEILSRDFVGPFASNADAHYSYQIADTTSIEGRRAIRLLFKAKNNNRNAFNGECLVIDSTYALASVTLLLDAKSQVNFLDQLHYTKKFHYQSGYWLPLNETLVTEFSAINKRMPGFRGERQFQYQSYRLDDPIADTILSAVKSWLPHVTDSTNMARNIEPGNLRPVQLSMLERQFLDINDSLERSRDFQQLKAKAKFVTTGYIKAGPIDIGPWFYWLSGNNYEGLRLRTDVRTNLRFNSRLWLHGYLAYGTKDRDIKGKAEAMYLLQRSPRLHFRASYSNDLDFSQTYYSDITGNNLFAGAFRRSAIPLKFMRKIETRFEYFQDLPAGLSTTLVLSDKQYNPLQNLPAKSVYQSGKEDPFKSFELTWRLRFAYREQFIESDFFRMSRGSRYPGAEIALTRGIKGLFHRQNEYTRISGRISHTMDNPRLGIVELNLFGAKTFGTVPYVFLDPHPGNELHMYNQYAFNMINRYEILSDRFVSFNMEHNIGAGIFKLVPSLKWRQFWNLRVLRGGLSPENTALNLNNNHGFKQLDGKTYTEIGTGVDNILKVLRLDLVWNVSPQELVSGGYRFGVFGSFRVQL